MEEEWRDVVGYEGLYKVSNFGRIKSLEKMRGAFNQKEKIKSLEYSNGYLRCKLHKNKKGKKFLVHVLVAKAFIPNLYNKPYIHHIDANRSNNKVDNLLWCTAKENSNFEITYSKKSDISKKFNADITVKEKKRHTTCCKPVIEKDINGNIINYYYSISEVKRITGLSVGSVCLGKYKTVRNSNNFFSFYDKDRDVILIAEYARRVKL